MPVVPWDWNNPIHVRKLTGKWRPRYQKWWRGGGYVIQVQVKNTHVHIHDSRHRPTASTFEWRDATADDLMQLAMKSGPTFDQSPPAEAPAKAA